MVARIRSAVRSGSSTCGQWPRFSSVVTSACGIRSMKYDEYSRGGITMSLPAKTRCTGTSMVSRPSAGMLRMHASRTWNGCVAPSADRATWRASCRVDAARIVGDGLEPEVHERASVAAGSSRAARSRVVAKAAKVMPIATSRGSRPSYPPAGAIAVTVRARPRRASSRAAQPPSELPTTCAVRQPTASISRSRWSTIARSSPATTATDRRSGRACSPRARRGRRTGAP